MKKGMITTVILAIILIMTSTFSTFAESNVKMTVYNQIVKSGNTLYCAGEGCSLYKVKVKNGKVVNKKKIYTVAGGLCMGEYSYIDSLKKKGKYLYYIQWSDGVSSGLCRIKLKGKKPKLVAKNCIDYAMKGNKLYAEIYKITYYDEFSIYRVMKLNGKNKKETAVKPAVKHKRANTEKYSLIYKESGKYVKTYLKTNKGKYYLGKTKLDS